LIRFICGCRAKIDPPINEEIFKTFDSVVLDWQGFIICQIHHERRYGWRTVPYTATAPDQALTAGMTALEHERWLIWGETPKVRPWPAQSVVEDLRDNRDPVLIGLEIFARRESEKNGNLERPRDGLDKDGWPKRWSDPHYLGDGPWGA